MAKASSSTSVSVARWHVGVLAAVVLSFMLASVIAEHMESAIAGRAKEIVRNTMPSVQLLSGVRGDVRKLAMAIVHYAEAPPDQRHELRDGVLDIRNDIDATLTTYLALPFAPGERGVYTPAEVGVVRLDHTLAEALSRPDAVTIDAHRHATQDLDAALERLVAFDAARGQRLGAEIERIRNQTRTVVILLDAVSVVLAILAALLALRQLRHAARAERAERDVRDRRERQLASENEALGQFAGRVAHDILSPLSSAMLSMELVRRSCGDDPVILRTVDRGVASVTRVQALVDALLTFSRAGGTADRDARTEIAPVVADVVEGLGVEVSEQRISLSMAAIPPGAIACSKGVLTSLLLNLLRNAIKYMGDAVERRIDLRVIDSSERWRIEVEDTGPGIPAAQLDRIFRPHVQLRPGSAGLGLGLATVDRLVRAHAGSLGVISAGRGALFWFELPKASRPAREAASQESLEYAAAAG